MRNHKICGLIAAPFTPFSRDGSLDCSLVPDQAQFLKRQGVAGVFVGGTTGEGASLTVKERLQLVAAWMAEREENFQIIVHVGHASSREGAVLARHAQEIGADAIGGLYSHPMPPASIEALADYCADLAAGAPGLPFYYYHMPAQTGLRFKAVDILRACSNKVETLAGCKFTDEKLMDFQECMELENGRFDILFGRDEMILASLAVGAQGWVGSTYNYAGLLHLDIIRAFECGDLQSARQSQGKIHQILEAVIAAGGGLSGGKAVSRLFGLDLGPVRPPLRNITDAELRQLKESLGAYSPFAGEPLLAAVS